MSGAAFLCPNQVDQVGNHLWELLHEQRYRSVVLSTTLTIPKGFRTDFASVPRWIPFAYMVVGNRAHAAAVVHDFLYQTQLFPREPSDDAIYEGMAIDGYLRAGTLSWTAEPWPVRSIIWSGVRAGGWVRWNRGPERRLALNPVVGDTMFAANDHLPREEMTA